MAERLQVEETKQKVEQTNEMQSEAASSTQDPEFGPVWPLPSPPHQRSAILKPLLFPEPAKEDRSYLLYRSRDLPLPCVLCEKCYGDGVREGEREEGVWEAARDQLLRHLLDNHQIVIHQADHIASLRRYCQFWRERFTGAELSQFCPVIRTNTDPTDPSPSQDYYLMSDALPEDKQLRQSLQLARLEAVLDQQQSERTDTEFKRSCLFCGMVVTGNRAPLFQHMLEDHSFNVGQPDNLVFVREFLDLLQQKLDNLVCLYCEKTFKDRTTLKEHMRKKQHKKINPNNTEYDRFYIINYLEVGRNWQEVMAEEDEHTSQRNECWDDWYEDRESILYCLFCSSYHSSHLHTLTSHMKEVHQFSWHATLSGRDYYQQMKAVNYIRRQVSKKCCPVCLVQCSSEPHLLLHMNVKGHCTLPSDLSVWDQSQYLFPTFENDALLCFLDDSTDFEATPTNHEP